MTYRTGIGYDIHRFTGGRKLFLGGVEIPFAKGLDGHSDADVLLHALCDALLGAAGEKDIGEHFPPSDARYRDISSRELLAKVKDLVGAKGYVIGNVDTVIITEAPRLNAFKPAIRQSIAALLGLDEDCVSVKAKSQEGLGAVGAGEGMAAWATVLLTKKSQ